MKIGDILIAIDECKMEDTNDNALIIGKHYPIVEIDAKNVYIESEIANLHSFKIKTLSEFFKQGEPEKQPKDEMSKLIEWLEEDLKYYDKLQSDKFILDTYRDILKKAKAIQNDK